MARPGLYDVLDKLKNQELNAARLYSAEALQHPAYQRAKLQRLRSLRAEYGLDGSLRNDLGFVALRAEIRVVERQLFPHPLLRLVDRSIAALQHYFGPERLIEHERLKIEKALRERQAASAFPDPETSPTAKQRFQALVEEALQQGRMEQVSPAMAVSPPAAPLPVATADPPPGNDKVNQRQQKTSDMNNVNYANLNKEMHDLGFGNRLQEQLKAEMQTGQPKFALVHRTAGSDERTAYLNFSKQENGDYALTNYRLSMKHPQFAEPVKQTFYNNPGEKNVTLEQATNLLQGRAVHRELHTKEGVAYKAWQQLDFNQQSNGNFHVRPYGEKYGYDFDKVLQRYAIAELQDPAKAAGLKEALRNGHRVKVTATIDGSERAVLMEANPRFKTMNFMDTNGVRLKPEQLLKAVQGVSNGVEQNAKQAVTAGSEELPQPKASKGKRKGQQPH